MSLKDQILKRVKVVVFAAAILCLLVAGKMIHLQVFQRGKWNAEAAKKVNQIREVQADRGNILAKDGRVLASSVPNFRMRIDFKMPRFDEDLYKKSVDSLAICLSQEFGWKTPGAYKQYLLKGLKSGGTAFPLVPYWVDYFQLDKAKQFPFLRESFYKTGFYTERKVEREKPFGTMARRTLGEMDAGSNYGIYGLEQSFDTELKGKKGKVVEKKIGAKTVRIPIEKPQEGYDLVTTIDVNLQDVAETSLRKQLDKYNADHGCAVLMEVETGDVLAIANLTKSGEGYRELYNYAVGESSEPGSTFKLVSFVVALEDDLVDLDKYSNTGNGVRRIRGARMTDSHDGGYGNITYRDVFVKSSNIGTSLLIDSCYRKDPRRYIDRLYHMHLHEPTGISIKGEPDPYITSPDKSTWSGISLPWMSIGYEVKLTPLQILSFYNAIANDGTMVKPRLVKAYAHRGDIVKELDSEVVSSSIASRSTIKAAKQLMEDVVEYGTARNLKGASLKIAGKTGTAQVAKGSSGYRSGDRMSYKASFCGYFPADNPKYSCIVVVTDPVGRGYYGNVVAGPVFRDIADKVYSMEPELAEEKHKNDTIKPAFTVPISIDGNFAELKNIYKYLDVNYNEDMDTCAWVRTVTSPEYVDLEELPVRKGMVPNVVGMGAMDAVFLLEKSGVAVTMKGKGRVKKQSINPGVLIRPGLKITLTLG